MKHGRPLTHVVRWGLGAVIVGAALALGSLDTTVLCVVAVALAVLVGLSWGTGEGIAPRPAATVLVGVAALLLAWTAVQAIPLPASVVAGLSPHAGDVWSHALDPLHEAGPASVTLSLDPIATRVELLRGAVYVAAFLVALRVGHRREGTVFLERALVVAGVLMAAIALLHVGLGAHKVYGLYKPKTGVTLIAPLLNVNQLGGYFVVALCVAYGSLISPEPLAARPLLALVVLALVAAVLWVPSRGAVGSMIVGLGATTALTIAQRRPSSGGRSLRMLGPVLLAGAGIAMMMFATSDAIRSELGDTNISKLAVQWRALTAMSAAYPFFGAGRGAFESTFPEFRGDPGYTVFTYPENVVVQWVSEWGVPVAALGFIGIAWSLRPKVLLTRGQPPIGAWAAFIALSLHNLVDFSSEVPGVVVSLVTCAALVVAGSADGTSRLAAWGKRPRAVAGAVIAVVVIAVATAFGTRGTDLLSDRLASKGPATDASVTNEVFFAALRATMLRHPAEAYFPYLGAVRMWAHAPDQSVVPWVDRTLERSPIYPPAHLVLARWLRTRSRSQALLEYRLAAEQEAGQVAAEAQLLVRTFEDVLELAPRDKAGLEVLEGVATGVRARLPATSARVDAELTLRDPSAGMPHLRALRDAVADLDAGESSPWCDADRGACARAALEVAKRAEERLGDRCEPFALEARVHVALGEVTAALDGLTHAADKVADRANCLRQLARVAIEARQGPRATEAIDKLANTSCTEEHECVDNLLWAAVLEQQRGNKGKALILYTRAAEASPDREDLTLEVARSASGAGVHSASAAAWEKLAAKHPNNAAYVNAARDERAAAQGLRQ